MRLVDSSGGTPPQEGICLEFPIEAVPKGRPRFGVRRGGHVRTWTPEATVVFERNLQIIARQQYRGQPLEGPLILILCFRMTPPVKLPKDRCGLPCVKPDLDNLEKAVMDALNGIAWRDDSQIVTKMAQKKYGNGSISLWVYPTKDGTHNGTQPPIKTPPTQPGPICA